MKKLWILCVCGLLAGLLTGGVWACGGDDGDGDGGGGGGGNNANAESGDPGTAAESAQFSTFESSLAFSATANADPSVRFADQVASAAADNASSVFSPSNCVDATADGATVTYNLNGCTGPLGMAEITGIMTADYTLENGDDLTVDIAATDLNINNAAAQIDMTAAFSRSGDEISLQVTTNSSGTTGRGRAFTRSGTYTASWTPGEGCISLDGDWDMSVGGATWSTTVSSYTQCEGECPQAGGELTWQGEGGGSLSLSFDGSDQVSWQTGGGSSGTANLRCGS